MCLSYSTLISVYGKSQRCAGINGAFCAIQFHKLINLDYRNKFAGQQWHVHRHFHKVITLRYG